MPGDLAVTASSPCSISGHSLPSENFGSFSPANEANIVLSEKAFYEDKANGRHRCRMGLAHTQRAVQVGANSQFGAISERPIVLVEIGERPTLAS